MNELTNIDILTTEILILKEQTAENIIEIGKRLIQVKEQLNHGEWLPYLKEKVEFSQQTANRFMRSAKEFSNYSTLSNLERSKIYALLDLPAEDREDFINDNDIESMTVKELKKTIEEKLRLEEKLKNVESELMYERERPRDVIIEQVYPSDYEDIKNKIIELESRSKTLDEAKEELKNYSEKKKKVEDELKIIRDKFNSMVEKDKKLTTQSYLLAQIDKAVSPLRKSKADLELLLKKQREVSQIGLADIRINADFLLEMSNLLYNFCNQVNMEVFVYGEEQSNN